MGKGAEGALTVVTVIAVILVGLGLVCFVEPRLRLTGGRIASNEAATVAALRCYLCAQNTFHRTDFYGIGKTAYASPRNGVGFPDLYEVGGPASGGTVSRLIDVTFAGATPGGGTKAGYHFADITGDADGPYDPEIDCGLCAVPARYNRTGRNIFIIDVTGTVYMKDAGVQYPGVRSNDPVPPLTTYPSDAEIVTKWIPVGCD